MIQRLQSVFLILASGIVALLFVESFPFATITGGASMLDDADQAMLADGVFNVKDHIVLLILSVLGVLIPLIVLFLFKSRPVQLKINRICIALLILLLVLSVILLYRDYNLMAVGTEVSIEYGYLFPLLAILLLVLAQRYISKDERLVRSADRLR